jgi:hypothetical protein
MIQVWWRAVDLVSGLLEPAEREAVRGDLAESGATGGRALLDVLGLVLRRQAAAWKDGGPWLALVVLVVPLGLLLGLVSRGLATSNAIYTWFYFNNWTWAYVDNAGLRLDLARHSVGFVVECITLISWSWTAGFVLGSLSRRATWANGALFCVLLFADPLGNITTFLSRQNSAVFALTVYRVGFPLILRTVLVVIPAVWGMYHGVRQTTLPLRRTIPWALAIIAMTVWLARTGLLLMVWPVVYMVATASWYGLRRRVVGRLT